MAEHSGRRADEDDPMKLLRYERPVQTVFGLLGTNEDDMTYALGFVMSRSPRFACAIASELGSSLETQCDGVVRLQQINELGRTDVELHVHGRFAAVFEAKRGPHLPSLEQLQSYVPTLRKYVATDKYLVAVTNAPHEYARRALPDELDGVPVRHLTWRRIRELATATYREEGHKNKAVLRDFTDYLRELLGMEMNRSNMVYVVSLNSGVCWGLGNRAVVNERRRYFYPVGGSGGWPSPPPNYIAFRYEGRLQSIHHVDSWTIISNPRDGFAEAENTAVPEHYLLR